MSIGKLYEFNDDYIVNVNYQFYEESETSWWGELVPTEYRRLGDNGEYILELDDGRRGRCSLRKRVNLAVSSVPPIYHFYFRGLGLLR